MKEIDYSILPEHMRDGMRRYVERGIRPGDFQYLVLCNDFVHALCHADDINTARIADYAKFLYLELPSSAWGSEEKVKAWIVVQAKKFLYLELPMGCWGSEEIVKAWMKAKADERSKETLAPHIQKIKEGYGDKFSGQRRTPEENK